MPPLGSEGLHEGRSALERADWIAARSAFMAVLEGEDSAEARDGLAQALWFLGEVTEAVALRERAFEDYVRLGRCDDAVRVAVWVCHQHMIGGRPSAARGWLARSESSCRPIPKSWASVSNHPARLQRSVCGWTAVHGGSSWGSKRHGQPARTIQRNALKIARSECSRCGASSFIKVK